MVFRHQVTASPFPRTLFSLPADRRSCIKCRIFKVGSTCVAAAAAVAAVQNLGMWCALLFGLQRFWWLRVPTHARDTVIDGRDTV